MHTYELRTLSDSLSVTASDDEDDNDQWLNASCSISFSMSLNTYPSEWSAMKSINSRSNLKSRCLSISSIISRVSSFVKKKLIIKFYLYFNRWIKYTLIVWEVSVKKLVKNPCSSKQWNIDGSSMNGVLVVTMVTTRLDLWDQTKLNKSLIAFYFLLKGNTFY